MRRNSNLRVSSEVILHLAIKLKLAKNMHMKESQFLKKLSRTYDLHRFKK
jgi:hypothetical protein